MSENRSIAETVMELTKMVMSVRERITTLEAQNIMIITQHKVLRQYCIERLQAMPPIEPKDASALLDASVKDLYDKQILEFEKDNPAAATRLDLRGFLPPEEEQDWRARG